MLLAKMNELEARKDALWKSTQAVDAYMSKTLKERRKVVREMNKETNIAKRGDIALQDFLKDSEHLQGIELLS